MTYYVDIEFENRESINLYRGTSDRLARVYLDTARQLIVKFNAHDACIMRVEFDNQLSCSVEIDSCESIASTAIQIDRLAILEFDVNIVRHARSPLILRNTSRCTIASCVRCD